MRQDAHRRRRPDVGSVKINGEMPYLWWTVDHEGEVVESFASKARDKAAALTFTKTALKRHGSPRAITIDGLQSCKAAFKAGDKLPLD